MSFTSSCSELYRAQQVIAIDRYATDELGIPDVVLMKRAGREAFSLLLQQWPEVEQLHIFCGSGNNGGDGYVIAALAQQRNLKVNVWSLSDPEQLQGAAHQAWQYACQEGVEIQAYHPSIDASLAGLEATVIVDALLGTGSQGAPRDVYAAAIEAINQTPCPVLAVDIPSGVHSDTGRVQGIAVRADVTMSMVACKQGLFTGEGREYSGQRFFTDLDLPAEVYDDQVSDIACIDYQDWLPLLADRAVDAHKRDHGHLLVVGGDEGLGYGYGGAPIMAAQMALRTGSGLVSVATRPTFISVALSRQPELMVAGIDNGQMLLPMFERASGIVIGPGLGQSSWSEQLLYQTLASELPLVLDADALRLLAQNEFQSISKKTLAERQWILTPHPGEAAALLNVSIEEVQQDRFAACAAIQQQYGGAVVLKGAGSIVTLSNGEQWLCDQGNPGMAVAGMGDVLSGLLGSLLVQGMSIDAAVLLGVSLHSRAGDQLAEEQGQRGLAATDLIPLVRTYLNQGQYE